MQNTQTQYANACSENIPDISSRNAGSRLSIRRWSVPTCQ